MDCAAARAAGRVKLAMNPIVHPTATELASACSLDSATALNHSTVLLAQADAAHTLAPASAITRVCAIVESVSARLDGQERIAVFPLAPPAAPIKDSVLFLESANAT